MDVLREALQTAGISLASYEVRDLVAQMDCNKDNQISFEEFQNVSQLKVYDGLVALKKEASDQIYFSHAYCGYYIIISNKSFSVERIFHMLFSSELMYFMINLLYKIIQVFLVYV